MHGAKTVRDGWAQPAFWRSHASTFYLSPACAGLFERRRQYCSSQENGRHKGCEPKAHAKGASGSKASSSSTKAHSESHPAASQHAKSSTAVSAHNSKAKYVSARKNGKKKPRGQQKIEPERAQAIQEALIREHYMSGEPTGTWNQSSEDAMRRYQADHGWQSKTVPDSRALISLGLGPSHDHLLNPESAMTTGPNISHAAPVSSSSQSPLSHSAEPERAWVRIQPPQPIQRTLPHRITTRRARSKLAVGN